MKRIGALVLILALTLGLVACGKKDTPSEPTDGKTGTEDTDNKGNEGTDEGTDAGISGTFTGTAKGYGGDVTVTLTLENGKITDCKAEGPDETEGIGSVAVEQLPAAIVADQSISVDSMSGATFTSQGVIEAVKAALTAAGLNPSDYEKKVEKTAGSDMEKTADIVIVGAGGAGMTAAITAAKAGKKVIIVESEGMVGGNSVRATGGMNAGKTSYQDNNTFEESGGVEKTLAAAAADYVDNEAITALAETVKKQWDEYQASPTGYFDSAELFELDTMIGGKGINNFDLVKTLAEKSADSITWLTEIGADLKDAGSAGGASVKRIHRPLDADSKVISVGSYLIPILQKNCEDQGVEIILNTKAETILTDENGNVTGITGTATDGSKVQITAGAVVLATGGFGGNLDMVTSYKPELTGFVTTNASGARGDGIAMATAVGAATVDMDQIQIHPTVEQSTSALITEGLRGDGAILVNAEGQRFCDEVGTRDAVSAAEIAQTDSFAWLVIDQNMVDASSVIAGYISKGYTVQGDSYEALAEAMGVDASAFAATMGNWNSYVEAGSDPEFGRTSFANQLNAAPYYAVKVAPGVHHTMGGLVIDTETHVLNAEGNAIPGLFAAGEVTGGIHGANRLGGNAVTDFVVFGRIAGQNAADYTNK